MSNQPKFIAISIESRKGGVGKTSIAMNLSRLLIDSKKFEVIFLDLDISGTDASTYYDSLEKQQIWKQKLYNVRKVQNEKDFFTLNLVELFKSYMEGQEIQKIIWYENETDIKNDSNLALIKQRINIFSSSINRNISNKNELDHHYGPAALFDEVHSQWFIAMIKEIVINSLKTLSNGKQLVIIIDNAPGYSGLEPVIEEWLTDLGPVQGKFLFVCSIDTPDLLACFKSIVEINDLFSLKRDAAKNFFAIVEKKEEISIPDVQKTFFHRLIESYSYCGKISKNSKKNAKCISCGLCYYREISINEKVSSNVMPQSYLAIVANKVPEKIYNEKYKLKLGDVLTSIGFEINSEVTLDNFEDILSNNQMVNSENILQVLVLINDNKIPFRDQLSFQYCFDHLMLTPSNVISLSVENREPVKHFLSYCKRNFSQKIEQWNIPETPSNHKKIQAIELFDESIEEISRNLSDHSVLTIRDFWSSDFFFANSYKRLFLEMSRSKKRFFISSENRFDSFLINDYSNIAIMAERNIKKLDMNSVKVRNIFRSVIKEFTQSDKILNFLDIKELENIGLDFAIDLVIARSFDRKNKNYLHEHVEDSILIISLLIDFIIENDGPISNKLLSGRSFWLTRSRKTTKRFQKILDEVSSRYIEDKNIKNTPLFTSGQSILIEFCNVRLRYLDIKQDFDLFINCIGMISFEEKISSKKDIFKLKDFCQQIIINKSTSHEDGALFLNDLENRVNVSIDKSDIFQNAEELSEYTKVLSSIIGKTQWHLL